jgi:hypothetical protein
MLTSLDYTDDLDSYFQNQEIIPYASAPAIQHTVLDSSESDIDGHPERFVKGILIALPISASIWGAIFLAVLGIFF